MSKQVFVWNYSYENECPCMYRFIFLHFLVRFTQTLFETEVQGNLEMAYLKRINNSEMSATKQLRNTQRIFVQI